MDRALFLISFLVLVACAQPQEQNSHACEQKQKSIASLNLAKDSLSKVRDLYPHCGNNHTSSNSSQCGIKEKSLGYLDVAENLINDALESYPNCSGRALRNENKTSNEGNKTQLLEGPIDCSQILERGNKVSGVYSIWLKNDNSTRRRVEVFCDMDTDGGGWTVIQRRGDFPQQENFFRVWADYKKGFGNITRDFWLGNDNIFSLANQSPYSIRFDLEDSKELKAYAVYETFNLGDESSKYLLQISNYSGDAGDAMQDHNNKKFSTIDNGNDGSSDGKYCTRNWKGGWWYANCYKANLNGVYSKGSVSDYSTVNWLPWRNNNALTSTEIKLRPNSFEKPERIAVP